MDLKGTTVLAAITPTSTEDQYPTHIDTYQQGGMRVVQSLAERDGIPLDRRKEGMVVFVVQQDSTYRLFGGITNTDWRFEDQPVTSTFRSLEPMSILNALGEPEILFQSDGEVYTSVVIVEE